MILYQLPKKHFEKYKVIIGDEVHTFAAKSLKTIMHKTTDCQYKFGLTGTLDDTESHHLVLEGLFGSVKKVTTTKQLMDSKQISDLKISGLHLQSLSPPSLLLQGLLLQGLQISGLS